MVCNNVVFVVWACVPMCYISSGDSSVPKKKLIVKGGHPLTVSEARWKYGLTDAEMREALAIAGRVRFRKTRARAGAKTATNFRQIALKKRKVR